MVTLLACQMSTIPNSCEGVCLETIHIATILILLAPHIL